MTVTPAVALDPQVYPQTWQGKAFVTVVIVFGVLFLAMPLSTIGSNFNKVWEERQLLKLQRLLRQLLMENSISADDCKVAFEQMDQDGNGEVSWDEFLVFLTEVLGLQIPKKELKSLWRMIDENASGTIDFNEFSDALFPSAKTDGVVRLLAPNIQPPALRCPLFCLPFCLPFCSPSRPGLQYALPPHRVLGRRIPRHSRAAEALPPRTSCRRSRTPRPQALAPRRRFARRARRLSSRCPLK